MTITNVLPVPSLEKLPHAVTSAPGTIVRRSQAGVPPEALASWGLRPFDGGSLQPGPGSIGGLLRHYACLGACNRGIIFFAAVPNRWVLTPCVLLAGTRIVELAIEVSTAVAGSARVSVWHNIDVTQRDLYPGVLLVDSGVLDTGTTGFKSAAVNVEVAQTGVYWFGFNADAGPSIHMLDVGSNQLLSQFGGTPGGPSARFSGIVDINLAFGAPPDPFPLGATLTGDDEMPMCMFVQRSVQP